jgi:hypothetical protein
MNLAVFNKLVDLAKKGRNISYQKLCDQCSLGYDMHNPDDRNKIGSLLGEISTTEHNNGRPLISVLVFRDDTNMPGDGFFELAHRLGLYNGGENEIARDNFFVSEFAKVCNYWNNAQGF